MFKYMFGISFGSLVLFGGLYAWTRFDGIGPNEASEILLGAATILATLAFFRSLLVEASLTKWVVFMVPALIGWQLVFTAVKHPIMAGVLGIGYFGFLGWGMRREYLDTPYGPETLMAIDHPRYGTVWFNPSGHTRREAREAIREMRRED